MEFKKRNPKIFIISGKARSGKNEIAKIIKQYYNNKTITISFGHYIKDYAKRISDWDGREETKPRELLQQLGIELIKSKINDKLFINRILEDIEIFSYFYDIIVISDVRLVEEIETLKKNYPSLISIRVTRPNYDNKLTIDQKKHITEIGLDNYENFDYVINNDSKLKEKIIEILGRCNMNKVVAIDGPAGSGKGTVAKILAEQCNLVYIDTGAMYRAIAYLSIQNNIDIKDEDKIVQLAKSSNIEFIDGKTYLNGLDVSKEIRTMEVTRIVSPISSIVKLREILVDMQRKMGQEAINGVIMEGRDITTVVFPDATYKFYLDASLDERAQRRYKENIQKGMKVTLEEIKENISKRDYNDMHKEVGSLTRTNDSIYIDSTNLTIEEVVNKIKNVIEV